MPTSLRVLCDRQEYTNIPHCTMWSTRIYQCHSLYYVIDKNIPTSLIVLCSTTVNRRKNSRIFCQSIHDKSNQLRHFEKFWKWFNWCGHTQSRSNILVTNLVDCAYQHTNIDVQQYTHAIQHTNTNTWAYTHARTHPSVCNVLVSASDADMKSSRCMVCTNVCNLIFP